MRARSLCLDRKRRVWAEIALLNKIHLVVGVIKRDGGTLYCSSLTYGPNGRLLSKHRKLMPTALERLVWGFGDGSTIGVVGTSLGRNCLEGCRRPGNRSAT